MPAHLLPITRREFLLRSVVAGTGILAIREPWLYEPRRDRDRWALLADTHIPSSRDMTRGDVNMSDHLERVAKEITALDPAPAGLVVNGDCAYLEGLPGDYSLLTDLSKPFLDSRIPLHMTLGNHDQRENFWTGIRMAAEKSRPLQTKHVAVVESRRANWFLLDSLDQTNVTPGRLGEEQLKWLAQALDAQARKPAIVIGHHQPGHLGGGIGGLLDSQALFDVIVPRKHVKAYIFGHTHHWSLTEKDGIHLINLPPVAYVFQPADPSGWVDVHLTKDGATLELRSLDPAHEAHGKKHELKWREC